MGKSGSPKKRKAKEKSTPKKPRSMRSGLKDHAREGKTLRPPLMGVGMTPTSWLNDRLPEMLWVSLILTAAPETAWSDALGHIAAWYHNENSLVSRDGIDDKDRELLGVSLTDIAAMTTERRSSLIAHLCSFSPICAALRPLALFTDLPAREDWRSALDAPVPDTDWHRVADSVGATLDHQSLASTHARWLTLATRIIQGFMVLPSNSGDLVQRVLRYPEDPKPREGATVRSMELAFASHPGSDTGTSEWPAAFWDQCLKDTECAIALPGEEPMPALGTTKSDVATVRKSLIQHALNTRATSGVHAKHEATFGFGLYALSLLTEAMGLGNATSILGRLGLRTLAEVQITLAYLLHKDDEDLWMAHRKHGAGQAKLNLLKLEEAPPSSIDVEALERLAGEDLWMEFVPIELGQWDKTDLRKMSDAAGVKDVYDNFYGWPSNYTHGQWSALRDTEYQTCFNPLHRLHRVPLESTRTLPDVVACAFRAMWTPVSPSRGHPVRSTWTRGARSERSDVRCRR